MTTIRVRHVTSAVLIATMVGAVHAPAPASAAPGTLAVHLSFASSITATAEVYAYPAAEADWIDVPQSWDALLATTTVQVVDGVAANPASFALEAGTYRVCASLDVNVDYTGEPDALACVGEGAYLPANGDDVVVVDGGTTSVSIATGALQVDVGLPAGQVFDPRDVVHTFRAVDGEWEHAYARQVGAVTGTQTTVLLAGMAPGTYRVCWNPQWAHQGWPVSQECWDESLSPDGAADVTVAPGQPPSVIPLTPNPKPALRGHYDVDTGTQALNVDVIAYRRIDGRWVESDAAVGLPGGSRDFGLLVDQPDSYRLCLRSSPAEAQPFAYFQCWRSDGLPAYRVADATTIIVSDWGAVVGGLDVDLQPRGISGMLHEIYTGARGYAVVTLYQQGSDGTWGNRATRRVGRAGSGPYAFDNLPTGDYRVCFHHQNPEFVPGFAPECVGGPTLTSATTIHYEAGTAREVDDVVLDQGSRIAGTITNGDAAVPVELFTHDGRPVATTVADAVGAYAFGPLPHGRYRLAFNRTQTPAGPELRSRRGAEWWDDLGEHRGVTAARIINITGPTSFVADARLTAGGSIRGRFAGTGIGCRIVAMPTTAGISERHTETTQGGALDVGGLATGNYQVALIGASCAGTGSQTRYLDADSSSGWTTNRNRADAIAVTRGRVTVHT